MVVLVPCLMAVPLLMGGGEATRGMLQLLGPVNAGAAQLVGIGFIVVMATMAPASSSAFSREGRHFWLSKIIPVEPRLQVRGKLAQAYAVIGFAVVLVSAVGCLWLGWRWAEVFTVALAGLVGSLPPVVLGLAVDLWRPYLSWENPQQAIKQNLNVFLGMVTGGAAVAGLVQLVRVLLAWGHGLLPALTGAGTVALVAGGVGYMLLELQAARLYDRVEV
jgi:ABC-2 type transport system permease protein